MRHDPGPEANVGTWLAAHAAERPDHPALVVEATGERISYGELDARARRAADALRGLGVVPGDRVALALESEPLYLELYFAAAQVGAILIPLNTRLTAAELGFQVDDSDARLVVKSPALALPERAGTLVISPEELRARMPAQPGPLQAVPGGEAPQVILYTSGTTGRPKGAVLPHRKTYWNTRNAEVYFELAPADVVVVPIPLFHSFGLKILSVPTLFAGATAVLVSRFDPIGLQSCVARERATLLGAVPVMYQRMLDAGLAAERLASLRFAFSAGAALDVGTIERFWRAGVRLKQGYGQTETSILCCLDASDALSKAGSVGRPVRFGEVRIADERGRTVPVGERGEVVVRGPIVMLGYWRRPEETAASRIDGWHRTGDLGVMDAEGFVTLVGRLKDMYISGGENVYPAEVERVLAEHPDVSEVAVVGVPDERWGESGRAYVVPAGDRLDGAALLAWAGERLARYKLPREVVVVAELPRTASGKVQKHALWLALSAALIFAVGCAALGGGAKAPTQPPPLDPDLVQRGAILFLDARVSGDGSRSCATCHPGGGSDSKLYADGTEVAPGAPGARRTPTLRGLWQTAPYLWDGSAATVEDALARMLAVEMRNGAPSEADQAALAAYLRSLPPFDRGRIQADGAPVEPATLSVRRGSAVFLKADCDGCHPAPAFTTPALSEVGTGRWNAPTLRGVSTAMVLGHDGRWPDLETAVRAILAERDVELSADELAQLLAYLKLL